MSETELKIIETALQLLYRSVEVAESLDDYYHLTDTKNNIYNATQKLSDILDYDFDL